MRSTDVSEAPDLPETLRQDTAFITSDVVDAESQKTIGPSGFAQNERRFLARLFDFSAVDIRDLGLRDPIAEVDDYVLSLVKERHWVDTETSYTNVLDELRLNLGLHPNLEPLYVLERLTKGVRLLKLQAMHRRRDREIQAAIVRLNNTPT